MFLGSFDDVPWEQRDTGGTEELRLTPLPQSVRKARLWVASRVHAAGASTDVVDVAQLLTTELVTNAVKFGPAMGNITVRTEHRTDLIHITVSDDSPISPVLRHPYDDEPAGRGLLVEQLAARWGVALHPRDGKVGLVQPRPARTRHGVIGKPKQLQPRSAARL